MNSRQWTLATLAGTLLLAPLGMTACVWRTEHKIETVSRIDAHIVLDIRKIEQEASSVENYVRGDLDNPAPPPTTSQEGKPSSMLETETALRRLAAPSRWAWISLTPTARAEEPEKIERVNPQDESKAKEARRVRAKKVDELLGKGLVGENDRGYLEVLLPKGHPDKDLRKTLDDQARQENRDRRTIYLAIAQRQGDGTKVLPAIERVFAREIRDQLKEGQKFQVPRDKESYEEFLNSKLGKQHPDAKSGEWIGK